MTNHRRPVGAHGFTLIELMVTIAVAAALMLVAVPSFVQFQRNAHLTSLTNTLIAAINAARGEAMKRGAYAMVIPADGSNWGSGWVVFVDKDLSTNYDSAKDDVVVQQAAPANYITITGTGTAGESVPYVLYDGSGYSKTKSGGFGQLTLSIARNDVGSDQALRETRRVIVSLSGRTRTCRPATDTNCTATTTQ